jgi:hypothetical protein
MGGLRQSQNRGNQFKPQAWAQLHWRMSAALPASTLVSDRPGGAGQDQTWGELGARSMLVENKAVF